MSELNNQIHKKISELSGLLLEAKKNANTGFGTLDIRTVMNDLEGLPEGLVSLLVAAMYLLADGKPIDSILVGQTPRDAYVQVKLLQEVI
jgi:hypothetical protein